LLVTPVALLDASILMPTQASCTNARLRLRPPPWTPFAMQRCVGVSADVVTYATRIPLVESCLVVRCIRFVAFAVGLHLPCFGLVYDHIHFAIGVLKDYSCQPSFICDVIELPCLCFCRGEATFSLLVGRLSKLGWLLAIGSINLSAIARHVEEPLAVPGTH
jgi:hypothetical protein